MNIVSVLAVLKKNYMNLCHCLPQTYTKTINKLQMFGVPDDILMDFINLRTTDLINDAIVGYVMISKVQSEVGALQFCDTMDSLVDSESSKTYIKALRNGN